MATKKIENAMAILGREQKRRESLKKRNLKYIKEIIFLRRLIRDLARGLALFKVKENKYVVVLTKEQADAIVGNSLKGEGLNNFKNQIKVQEEK